MMNERIDQMKGIGRNNLQLTVGRQRNVRKQLLHKCFRRSFIFPVKRFQLPNVDFRNNTINAGSNAHKSTTASNKLVGQDVKRPEKIGRLRQALARDAIHNRTWNRIRRRRRRNLCN